MAVLINEIYKIFAGKKIYIFLLVLLLVSIIILAGAVLTRNIYALGGSYGQTFPLVLFEGVASFIVPVFVILLVSSLLTDEMADGSLTLPLLRRVSRTKLFIGKMGALLCSLFLLMLFLLLSGYGLGTAVYGWGDTFVLRGRAFTSNQGLLLILSVYALSILSYLSFGMVISLLAVLLTNSGSVVGTGTGLLLFSLVAGQILPPLEPYLLTSYFNTYSLLVESADGLEILRGVLIIVGYGVVFYIAAAGVFRKKDLIL